MPKTGPSLRLLQTAQHLGEEEVAGKRWQMESAGKWGLPFAPEVFVKVAEWKQQGLLNQAMRVQECLGGSVD